MERRIRRNPQKGAEKDYTFIPSACSAVFSVFCVLSCADLFCDLLGQRHKGTKKKIWRLFFLCDLVSWWLIQSAKSPDESGQVA
jgi:hypothetical protein